MAYCSAVLPGTTYITREELLVSRIASLSSVVTLSGTMSWVRFFAFLKASDLIVVTPSGISRTVRDSQFSKAQPLISRRESGRVTSSRDLQLIRHLSGR